MQPHPITDAAALRLLGEMENAAIEIERFRAEIDDLADRLTDVPEDDEIVLDWQEARLAALSIRWVAALNKIRLHTASLDASNN